MPSGSRVGSNAMTALDILRSTAARLTDTLAAIGERLPGIAQITIQTPVASVTLTPRPAPPRCPHCGK